MHSSLFPNNTPSHDPRLRPDGTRSRRKQLTHAAPSPRPRRADKEAEKRLAKLANFYANYIQPATEEETKFRHAHWADKRAAVDRTLSEINTGERALTSFRECGGECTVEWSTELQRYRTRANHCKSRHCEPCQRARAHKLAANLKTRLDLAAKGRYRFVTLTLRHSTEPLTNQLRHLYASFRRLRAMPIWKKSQHGGAFILEVKWNAKRREWHPHLHVITEGGWIEQRGLSNAWAKASNGSHIVDIRALQNGTDAAHYVSKYVTKGTSDAVWTDRSAAQEWIIATKGVRACATYGRWRGFKLMAATETATDWKPVATLTTVIRQAAAGQAWAQAVLINLRPPGKADEVSKRSSPRQPDE